MSRRGRRPRLIPTRPIAEHSSRPGTGDVTLPPVPRPRRTHRWPSTSTSCEPAPSIPRSTRRSRASRRRSPSTWPATSPRTSSGSCRLNQGIYGQRQGGTNQMVRVKVPYGRVEPEQLEMLASIAEHVLARLGSPHHAPERAVPLRRAARHARGAAPARVGRAHQPRGVRRHRAQRRRLPPRRRVPVRGARHLAVGRGRVPLVHPQPARRSGCRASSRSTSAAARPTAARRCSTTSA